MRSLSSEALAKLAQNEGAEPQIILAIQWRIGGTPVLYADRDIEESTVKIPGRILRLDTLDDTLNIDKNQTSSEIGVTLSDTDGSLKQILDTTDIHQRDVWVYQWFDGLDLDDKFLLFRGKISSPIEWSESERALSFNVVSQIEDVEFGFSPEEGEFTNIPDDLIGKPWPSVFGKYVHVPALRITESAIGTLGEGIGAHDFTIEASIAAAHEIRVFLLQLATFWAFQAAQLRGIGAEDAAKACDRKVEQFGQSAANYLQQGNQLTATLGQQLATEKSSVRILGGDRFPQGMHLTLSVGTIKLEGSFAGEIFSITKIIHPERVNYPPTVNTTIVPGQYPKDYPRAVFVTGRQVDNTVIKIYTGEIHGENAGFVSAQPGARVTISSAEALEFVASITPGSVISVSAWIESEGVRHLVDVPTSLYSVFTRSYGSITATIVRLNDALSKREGEGWSDDQIYVTFESTVGPNTVDVLQYIIETYTNFSINTASFSHVRTLIDNYPSHFAVLDRPQVLDLLRDIAFQARCSLFLRNDTFYLIYLPEEPTPVATINEDVTRGMKLGFTKTEDLVTKIVAKWKASGAQEQDNTIILRHNVAKYGTKEREINYFIYNNADLIIKSATYWLIRLANTWKQLRFNTPLTLLNVEAFDAVTLGFVHPFVANSSVTARVEEASYDSESRQIQFDCWTPVRMGEMTPYPFAYPADVDIDLRFPTSQEQAAGFAGGVGPGKGARGTFDARRNTLNVTYNGQPNPFHYGQSRYTDQGGSKPSDRGDQNPGKANNTTGAGLGAVAVANPTPPVKTIPITDQQNVTFIDLHKTVIVDQTTHDHAVLASFFKQIFSGRLQMDTEATITDGSNEVPFDFKFDGESGKFGAGTAFLKDD